MPEDRPNSHAPADAAAAGGDPVCWLHLVCESCGALLEREGDPHRPGCTAVVDRRCATAADRAGDDSVLDP